jgi:two-component system, OmpR family, response regulator RegX3
MTSSVLCDAKDFPRLLLVEEPRPLREALAAALQSKGYAIRSVHSEAQLFDAMRLWRPNLLLLDLSTYGKLGIAARQHIQDKGLPSMIIAEVGEEERVLSALESGARDFVMRPIDLEAMTLRINAALLASNEPTIGEEQEPDAIHAGPVVVYPSRRAVVIRGREAHLPKLEYDLLFLLLCDPGRVRTREEILCHVWANRTSDYRTLNTHIQRIRAKVEIDKSRPRHVLTMRNIGYYFDSGEEPRISTASG